MSTLRPFIIYSLCLFLTNINFVASNKRLLNVQIKSIKCTHDSTMFNGTVKCSIKPFRNGTQLTTALYTFRKPCDDIWVHMVVFFKFGGSALYRQWMFNVDENICEILKGNSEPQLLTKIIFDVVKKTTPKTLHKCPYVGEEGVKNVDLDQIIGGIVPHVLPTGDYRILFRFHTTSNKTFLEATFGGHIDAVNPLEAISMG